MIIQNMIYNSYANIEAFLNMKTTTLNYQN